MKHYQWPINLGLGALVAGGWSLPAVAVELLSEPIVAGTVGAAQLQSRLSQDGAIAPMLPPKVVIPASWSSSALSLENGVLDNVVASSEGDEVGFGPSAEEDESVVPSLVVVTEESAASEAEEVTFAAFPSQPPASAVEAANGIAAHSQVGECFNPEFSQLLSATASDCEWGQVQDLVEDPVQDSVQNYPAELVGAEKRDGSELALSPNLVTKKAVVEETPLSEGALQTVEGALLVQTEEIAEVLAEAAVPVAGEATPVEQTENILDNDQAPAGDLLESVDGLEETGIAGEGANIEQSDSATSVEDAEDETSPGIEQADDRGAADDDLEDEFDSDEFEAEEFDFDEDEGEIAPNPPGSTVEGDSEGDPDLGILRLRERPVVKQKPPMNVPIFLVGNVGYIGNGNTLAGVDPVNDRLFRSGVSLIASPRLSKRTALITSVQGNFSRYDELSRLDFNELRLQTSLRRVLTRRVYGDLGWTHRRLSLQDDGERFLNEHAGFANLTRRDPLSKKTSLTSFYNFRAGFADPETSSRLRNTLGVSVRHDLAPALQASLTGRMTLTNFTQQSRQDFYTQALAQLSYKISKNFRLSAFGSLTRGNSSNPQVDFDNSTVGISLSGNLKLF